MAGPETLVFDTGPLRHFARADWLGALKALVGDRTALVPDTVVAELRQQANADSRVGAVLECEWIQRRELTSDAEIRAFATFSARLVRGERNVGEAGVLALARVTDGVAVMDDRVACRAAADLGVQYRRTLALLVEGIRIGLFTVPLVSALADDLLTSEYRLPFQQGDFEKWAREEGMLDQPGPDAERDQGSRG